MKKFLITLMLLLAGNFALASVISDNAMKSAYEAMKRKDYVSAERHFGVAARELQKAQNNTSSAAPTKLPDDVHAITKDELASYMSDIKKFMADIDIVYSISKDPVTKNFLNTIKIAGGGADMVMQNPQMSEITNHILADPAVIDAANRANSGETSTKLQVEMFKSIFGALQNAPQTNVP